MSPGEDLIPLEEGPLQFHERQVTPAQLYDMRLGYLSNMGAEVELVHTHDGRVEPATIAAIGRTFYVDQDPDPYRLPTEEEMQTSRQWLDFNGLTLYMTRRIGDITLYRYRSANYAGLGLAPVEQRNGLPVGWDPAPLWYLRWPVESE